MKKGIKYPKCLRAIAFILGIIGVFTILFLIWCANAPEEGVLAKSALQSSSIVSFSYDDGILFKPKDANINTAFILYPGARVSPESYADTAKRIAENGYLVIVPKVFCNFALFSINAAEKYIDTYPNIKNWVIGGHSVGGTAAAMFVEQNRKSTAGIIFWASYPSSSTNLKNYSNAVTSIWADHDGLTTQSKIDAHKYLLPLTTQYICIKGGDHRQFADYPYQWGDHEATISMQKQHDEIVKYTLQTLEAVKNN